MRAHTAPPIFEAEPAVKNFENRKRSIVKKLVRASACALFSVWSGVCAVLKRGPGASEASLVRPSVFDKICRMGGSFRR